MISKIKFLALAVVLAAPMAHADRSLKQHSVENKAFNIVHSAEFPMAIEAFNKQGGRADRNVVVTKNDLAREFKRSYIENGMLKTMEFPYTVRKDLAPLISEMTAKNKLDKTMKGGDYLRAAEARFEDIILLVRYQKALAHVDPLFISTFGDKALVDLSEVLSDNIRAFNRLAERYLAKSNNVTMANFLRKTFVNEGLRFNDMYTLSPSEIWINEYLGQDRDYKPAAPRSDIALERVMARNNRELVKLFDDPANYSCEMLF